MPDTGKAVFLSYARDDAAAARRIAEALRASGLEVWFDENELRGGDAWDQKIRRQINDCTLFIAVISQHTESRAKGYFRLEWKLAVEQMHMLLEGVPFVVPVVVDDTPESAAAVPPEFLRVQWTRLPGALPTPQFVEQIRLLLTNTATAGITAPPMPLRAGPAHPANPGAQSAKSSDANRRTRGRWVAACCAGLITVATIFFFAYRPRPSSASARQTPDAPGTTRDAPRAVDSPRAANKSIAVLPFKNDSPDPENAFFTDGVHEDILTNLGNIHGLVVISRTSVEQYRGTTKTAREIGKELGVAYILEGSVQRVGNKVHVTGQLIDARADAHLWAKSYDRDLSDIFVIQAELAKAIAAELQPVLSPQEQKLIERRPTDSVAAYELVLKSREWTNQPTSTTHELLESRRLLEAAIKLDPNYAAAYADLAFNYVFVGRYGTVSALTHFGSAEDLQTAKAMVDAAARLAPGSPEVLRALGDYYYYGYGDFDHALEQYEKLGQIRPSDPIYFNRVGSIQRRQSRWLEALNTFRKLEEIDPGVLRYRRDIALLLAAGRRFDEAIAQQKLVAERAPGDLEARFDLACLHYVATGSTREVEQFFAGLTPAQLKSSEVVGLQRSWALRRGDLDGVMPSDSPLPVRGDFELAFALASKGNVEAARAQVADLAAELRRMIQLEPTNFSTWGDLGVTEAILGHHDDAVRCARKAVELMPVTRDALIGGSLRSRLALVYAWVGDKDAAIAEYRHLFQIPYGISGTAGSFPRASIRTMRADPMYAPLRGDPRWEALLNDAKNNAPLF